MADLQMKQPKPLRLPKPKPTIREKYDRMLEAGNLLKRYPEMTGNFETDKPAFERLVSLHKQNT